MGDCVLRKDSVLSLDSFKETLAGSLESYPPFMELRRRIREARFPAEAEGVQGGFLAYLAARLHEQTDGSTLLVVPTDQEAREIHADLQLFTPRVLSFPWWGTLPYGQGHPLPAVHGLRTHVLSRLQSGERALVVTSLRGLLNPLPEPQEFEGRAVRLHVGDTADTLEFAQRLTDLGYLRVPRVSLRGEFALRGEVLDVYPYGDEDALRIIFDFDTIRQIRHFEPFTQASVSELRSARVPPTREVVFDETALELLGASLERAGADPPQVQRLVEQLRLNPDTPGSEYLFPLCSGSRCSLLDYLGPDSLLLAVDSEGLAAGSAVLRREYLELYRSSRSARRQPETKGDEDVFSPPPRQILLDFSTLESGFERTVRLHSLKGRSGGGERITMGCDPPRSFFGNLSFLKEELQNLIELRYRIFVFAEYEHQAERLRHLLRDLEVAVLPQGISRGFSLPALQILVIEENEIFGRKRRIPRSVAKTPSRAIDSFVDLSPGDYVVHLQYGIGLFNGIERIKAAGHERDYICLEYDGEEKVFLPIEQVNLIQAYIAQEGRRPKLDKLGGRSWQSRKERVRRSVEEMARRLVSLYSARSRVRGFVFPPDTDWQSEFEARFPYQETEDQLKAIEEVKADMESARPMDRLICGDVGYGKTEVALRSAFKAVMGGKQVALLAPTTILAEQHYETFQERFGGYPVSIEMLSRFVKPKRQRQVLASLADGGADIVIGTHRLLQRDVKPKNLGLLIVDEEQRFGVRDKERLKELKTAVDCLTLTATPIPRTLHMALMKIRDMSIINTPPQNRYPIETFIQEFDEEVLCRAVRQEIDRGGQVYYLHNRVQTIPRVESFLARLIPEVRIATAHGQMREEELEEVMHSFIHGDVQLLLSTTIIENGLDIPNVNTIIIDRADMFGISQLYQLRGRVGRSDTPAYAYLFYPKGRVVSELAMKRLRIISDFTELGSGFKIALKDLEIRGAGNLLGREQHGDILAVGLDMYLRLLDEAIDELKLEETEENRQPPEVYLELQYSGYIPDGYVPEAMEKMELYKRIASVAGYEELEALEREVEDRFGPVPEDVRSLFAIAEIRILCRRLYVSSLKERGGRAVVEFSKLSRISVDRVMTLIRESGGSVSLDPGQPNCLIIKTGQVGLKEKSEFISDRLSRLL
ncbi:MAG: transcription-repair coupling factor [Spirochaetales bacterium]|nr:transcription-repair coupling factor [Spirochaetales bacterium]